jgi:hypothetical protein
MKMLIYIVVATLLLLAVFMLYIGVFETVNVEEKIEGGYVVAGADFVGPYAKTGPEFEKVSKIIKDMGLESTKGLGIYYDDPKAVEAGKCRSFIASVIEEKDMDKMDLLKEKGLTIKTIEKCNSLVIELPVRSSWSYMVGPIKAYPALEKYVGDTKYKEGIVYELYDMPAKKVFYIMQYKKE